MKMRINRLVPPGADVKIAIKLFFGEILIMALISCMTPIKITNANYLLFHDFFGYYFDDGHMMPYFSETVNGCMMFFWVIVLFNLSFGIANYRSFFKGSQSVYVMRRIPDPAEMFRRSFALPLLGIAAALITAIILLFVYYLLYRYLPPADRIYPVQFADFMRAFL